MELSHTFTVPASVEDTWAAFNDLGMVAGCFPGASLTSVEGDDFKGSCKVKLGPIALVYSGTGTFIERDESTHRFVIEALGKDKRGNGTAGATVTAALTSAALGSTNVEVVTDLAITGKPAQFGRGVIQDVSDKLLRQFVTCLESKVGETDAAAIPAEGAASTMSSAPTGSAASTNDVASTGSAASTVSTASTDDAGSAGSAASAAEVGTHRADSPVATGPVVSDSALGARPAGGEHRSQPRPVSSIAPKDSDDALDLGATVIPVLLKAYGKQVVAALLALFILRKMLGRRGR